MPLVCASLPIALSAGAAWARADSRTVAIDMCTRRPFSSPRIVGLSARYASALFAQMVSPPKGGTSIERSKLIAGGSGENAESVCQPDPKRKPVRSSGSLISGCTSGNPGTPRVYASSANAPKRRLNAD